MDPQHRFSVTRDQVSAAKQAWLSARVGGVSSVSSILHGDLLEARSAWLDSVDRGAPEEESQTLFQDYIAVVARAGVMTRSQQRRPD